MSPETRKLAKVIPKVPERWSKGPSGCWHHDFGTAATKGGKVIFGCSVALSADETIVFCADLQSLVRYLRAIGEIE